VPITRVNNDNIPTKIKLRYRVRLEINKTDRYLYNKHDLRLIELKKLGTFFLQLGFKALLFGLLDVITSRLLLLFRTLSISERQQRFHWTVDQESNAHQNRIRQVDDTRDEDSYQVPPVVATLIRSWGSKFSG